MHKTTGNVSKKMHKTTGNTPKKSQGLHPVAGQTLVEKRSVRGGWGGCFPGYYWGKMKSCVS